MLERRSALAGQPPRTRGTTFGVRNGEQPMVTLAERRRLAILQISAFATSIEDAGARLSSALGLPLPQPLRFTGDASRNLRAIGSGVWQAVADEGGLPAARALRDAMQGMGTVADLSHARTAIRIGGPAAARALAKHCGLDLDVQAFPAGAAANTRFGHLGATLARVAGGPEFELLVFRGYAEFVFEALIEGAAEFGVCIAEAG